MADNKYFKKSISKVLEKTINKKFKSLFEQVQSATVELM